MKYYHYLLAAIIILAGEARSQIVWEYLGGPKSSNVSSIAITSTGNLFAVCRAQPGTGKRAFIVYKSTDNGTSWTRKFDIDSLYATRIACDKHNNLYISGSSGFYRSTDEGGTWELQNTGIDQHSELVVSESGYVYDIGIDEYAYSSNGGTTWQRLPLPTLQDSQILDFEADENNTLYLSVGDVGVLKCASPGGTWIPFGDGNWKSVDRIYKHAGVVYVQNNATLYRSINDGASWTEVSAGLNSYDFYFHAAGDRLYAAKSLLDIKTSANHGASWDDIETAAFPNVYVNDCIEYDNTIYVCSSFGLYSYSPTAGWERMCIGYGPSEDAQKIIPLTDDRLMISANEARYECTSQGAGWIPSKIDIPLFSPVKEFASLPSGVVYISGYQAAKRTSDGGNTWETASLPDGCIYISSLLSDSQGRMFAEAWFFETDYFYMGGIYRSTDNGSTWAKLSITIPYCEAFTIDTHDRLYILVAGELHISSNAGETWSIRQVSSASTKMFIGRNDELILLEYNTLLISNDLGQTWSSSPYSYGPHTIQMFTNGSGMIYAALRGWSNSFPGGFIVSTDGGATWNPQQSGLNSLWISDALLHTDRRIYLATNDGVYRSIDPAPVSVPPTEKLSFSLSQAYPNPVSSGEKATVMYSLQTAGDVSVKVFSILGVEVYSSMSGRQEAGTHAISIPTRGLKPGVYECVATSQLMSQTCRLVVR